MIFLRPVNAVDAAIASRFASVPELVKRTSSIDGKRSQTIARELGLERGCAAEVDAAHPAPRSIAARIAGCE